MYFSLASLAFSCVNLLSASVHIMIPVFFSFIFSFILSCLIFSFVFSSLSLHSLSLSLSPCDVVCVSVCCVLLVCVVGVCCVWVWVFVCGCWLCTWSWWSVRCGTLRNPVCPLTKRLHVYVRNVTVCTGTTRTCVSTCARGARTHGDVLNVHTEASGVDTGSHRQFCLARKAHVQFSLAPERFTKRNERILPIFFEFGRSVSRTTCSRFPQSFPLPDEAVQLKLS